MKSSRISLIIDNACKKNGIEYKSINPHYLEQLRDAERLFEIYLQIKAMISELKEIGERHKINGLIEIFNVDIHKLEDIDHDIIKLVKNMREEKHEQQNHF